MNRSKINDPRWWLVRWLSAGAIAPRNWTPGPCNAEVFRNGAHVAAIAQGSGARCWHVEELICKVARESGTRRQTDWHYSGGIAQVLTLGDADKVAGVLARLWPAFLAKWPDSMIRLNGPALYRAGDPPPDDVIGVDSTGAFMSNAADPAPSPVGATEGGATP